MRAICFGLLLSLFPAFWCGLLSAQPDDGTPWRMGAELSGFHLVVPENASPLLRETGAVFQRLWRVATRRAISVSDANEGLTNVWLGSGIIPSDLLEPYERDALLPEEYLVRTFIPKTRFSRQGAEKQLFITGGSDLAVLRGVHAFFAHEMGVMWLEPGLVYAPKAVSALHDMDFGGFPEFKFCQIGLLSCWKEGVAEYRLANGLSSAAVCEPGLPDYFNAYDRAPDPATPAEALVAYGSEGGARRLVEEIKAAAAASGGQGAGAVPSGRDCPFLWETEKTNLWLLAAMTQFQPVLSEEGRALNEQEASPAAAILSTANAVAELLEESFPVDTHLVHVLLPPGMPPPRQLRSHPGVVVQLSTAECDFARPLTDRDSPENAKFTALLQGWRQSGARVYVYDHLVNARDPRLPFPCLDHLQANILFYAQSGIEGVYFAGLPDGCAGGADLAALRLFLAARLLFNPDASVEEGQRLFLEGYYGPAAATMENHLSLMRKALVRSGNPLKSTDDGAWLTDEVLNQAVEGLQEALRRDLPDEIRARMEDVLASTTHVQALRGPASAGPAASGGR